MRLCEISLLMLATLLSRAGIELEQGEFKHFVWGKLGTPFLSLFGRVECRNLRTQRKYRMAFDLPHDLRADALQGVDGIVLLVAIIFRSMAMKPTEVPNGTRPRKIHDDLAMHCLERRVTAKGVLLIVIDGDRGTGGSGKELQVPPMRSSCSNLAS